MEGILIAAAIIVALVLAGRYASQRTKGPGEPGEESPLPQRSQENRMRAAERPTHHGPVDEGPAYRHEDADTPDDQRP